MDHTEERIRQRAYRIWKEEGCPEGRAHEHWEKARQLVAIEDNPDAARLPNPLGGEGQTGEPVEPLLAVENAGEFPTLTDQGEEQAYPKARRSRRGKSVTVG